MTKRAAYMTRHSGLLKNEATWPFCEPTCLSLGSLFDLDQCDLWPWYLWPLTDRFHMKCTMQRPWNQVLFTRDLDLWPTTLTLHQVTFDLDPCDLKPRGHMSNTLCKVLKNHVFWHGDLDLWPMTLTFTQDLDIINIHQHTKFEPPKSNGSRDINFYLVTFGPMNYFLVTVRQTDRRTDRRKAMHKSPPVLMHGGLLCVAFRLSVCD